MVGIIATAFVVISAVIIVRLMHILTRHESDDE